MFKKTFLLVTVCMFSLCNFVAESNAATCVSPSGLVSWWKGENDAIDRVGGFDGTLNNGVTFATGKSGQAFSFDGVDDYISIPSTANLDFGTGPFSIAVWIKTTESGVWKRIVTNRNSAAPQAWYSLALSNNFAVFEVAAGVKLTSTTAVNDGLWHQIVVSRDDSGVSPRKYRMYIDGALNISMDDTGLNLNLNADHVEIGRWGLTEAYNGTIYSGLIDEIQMFNRSLSVSEIQDIYTNETCMSTTTSLSANSNQSSFGQTVNLTATVSPSTASGTVNFMDDTTLLGSSNLSGGTASFSTYHLTTGSHNLTAVYSGNSSYSGSTSSVFVHSVQKGYTQPDMSLPDSIIYGAYLHLYLSITNISASGINPTGNFSIKDGDKILCSGNFTGGLIYPCTIMGLSVGLHTLTMTYEGDSNFLASISSDTIMVKDVTTVSLSSSQNPSTEMQSITFTASVSPATASGTITFKDGETTLGSSPLSGGTASLSNLRLAFGSHNIVASYSGDGNYGNSTSSTFIQVVKWYTVPDMSIPSSIIFGTPLYILAHIDNFSGSSNNPTGKFTIKDGNNTLCSGNFTGSLIYPCTIMELSMGLHTLTMNYEGDSNYAASTSSRNLTVTGVDTPQANLIGANMATLALKSSETGIGYFTLLTGNNANCGSNAQIKAGLTDSGAKAFFHGSLPLVSNSQANYTVRNLSENSTYTVCFNAENQAGSFFQTTSQSALFNTQSSVVLPAGQNWDTVGDTAFSDGRAEFESLTFAPDGTPFVAFRDTSNKKSSSVMKYNGSSWEYVGNAGFTGGDSKYQSLAFAPDGTVYLAFMDVVNGNKSTVMKYSGNSWVTVGNAGFSAGSADNISLAFASDGTPHVAFMDGGNGMKATVMKYSGTNWDVVGSAGFSAGMADYISLVFAMDGTPYVAFRDNANNQKTTVMKYTGVSWVTVGNAGFSAGEVWYTSLAIDQNGTPYVAYEDNGNNQYATVMKFTGTAWEAVGNPGFSGVWASGVTLAISPDGSLFVAFENWSNDSGKLNLMKFNGSDWMTVGNTDFSAGIGDFLSLAFAPNGTPYVAYEDGGNGNAITVMTLVPTPVPVVTSLLPTSGPFGGGTLVTISGSGFTGATVVKFGNSNATSVQVLSSKKILAVVPAGIVGQTVDITVVTPGGTSAATATGRFTYLNSVFLLSDGFENDSLSGWSTTQLTGNEGAWSSVNSAYGCPDLYAPHNGSFMAQFNSCEATSGNQTRLYRTGEVVIPDSVTNVSLAFWMYHDSEYSETNDWIQPQISTDGITWSDIGSPLYRYAKPGGWSQVSIDIAPTAGKPLYIGFIGNSRHGYNMFLDDVSITGTLLPIVTAVSPSSGSSAGGTLVTITGSGFYGATTVNFGASTVPASGFTANSDAQISVISPAGAAGYVADVTVSTPSGVSALSSADHFIYTQDQAKNQNSGILYATLTDAILHSQPGSEIRAYASEFDATFILDREIILHGGYDSTFAVKASNSLTTLNGSMTVTSGNSMAGDIVIKGKLAVQGGSLHTIGEKGILVR